jgi:hypothetical protein
LKLQKRPWHYKRFSKPRTHALRALNNTYVINTIARESLIFAKDELESKRRTKFNYKVPTISQKNNISIAKTKKDVVRLIDNTVERDLFSQSIITAVAITEDYLSDSLYSILFRFPEKLASNDKKIDISLVFDSDNLEELIEKIIAKQIHSVFYSSPAKYFEYLENILSIKIPKELKEQYAEIKATRDIIVHNGGIINELYLSKSGDKSRATIDDIDEIIDLDSDYFDQSIRNMKKLVVSIYNKLQKKYAKIRT